VAVDWLKIKTEYETTTISQRKIAEKYGVSFNTLKDRANKEKWAKSKQETHNKITTKTQQKVVEKIVDRNARILSLADRLADKVDEAIEQLEQYVVTSKKKTKTVEYGNGMKPTKEVTVEEEIKDIIDGLIDKQGLKTLTAALKDIKDINTDKLLIETNNKNDNTVRIKLEGDLKEWAK
jgi:transposase